MSEPAPLFSPLKPATTEPRLWTGTSFVPDPWHTIADAEPFPIGGQAIVSLTRWRAEQPALAALGAPVGVVVQSSEALDFDTDDVNRLAVIALVFPKFTDGRAYSTARRLRESGYAGETGAPGDVLLVGPPLMRRAVFAALNMVNAATIHALEVAPLPAVSRVYQSGVETAVRGWRSRRAGIEATRQ